MRLHLRESPLFNVFVAPLLILLLVAAALARLGLDARDATAVSYNSNHGLRAAQDLLVTLVDAETGMRGYVITGNPHFGAPYRQASSAFKLQIANVQLVSHAPSIVRESGEIVSHALKSFAFLDRYVDLVDRGETTRARSEIALGSGTREMDLFRNAVATYNRAEEGRVGASSTTLRGLRVGIGTLLLFGALVALLTGILFYRTVRDAIAARLLTMLPQPGEPESVARTNSLNRALFGDTDRAIITTGTDGVITSFNNGAEKMLGYASEDVVGHSSTERFLLPGDRDVRPGRLGQREAIFVRADGSHVPICTTVRRLHDDAGVLVGYVDICEDITLRRVAEQVVVQDGREQQEFARQLRLIANTVATAQKEPIDRGLRLGLEQLGLERAFVCTVSDITGELIIDSSVGAAGESVATAIAIGTSLSFADAFLGEAPRRGDVCAVASLALRPGTFGGSAMFGPWDAYIAAPIYVSGALFGAIGFLGREARVSAFSAVNRDFVRVIADLVAAVVERGQQSDRLDGLAFFDGLTGLPNRVLLLDRLKQAVFSAERYGDTFALLYLDLDGFKAVNDTYGHSVGDEVLRVLSRRLEALIRSSDTVARLGGDEFLILAPKLSDLEHASELASRILLSMRQTIAIDGIEHALSVSIGISFYPRDGLEPGTLIDSADRALYAAKAIGKNTFTFAPTPAAAQLATPV